MTNEEWAWLAAMIDAEGSFGSPERSFFVIFCSTDLDTVQKVARLLQRDIHPKKHNGLGRKQQFYTEIYGTPAINIVLGIYNMLSAGRKDQVRRHMVRYGGIDAIIKRS
jgi:hypothetical protein